MDWGTTEQNLAAARGAIWLWVFGYWLLSWVRRRRQSRKSVLQEQRIDSCIAGDRTNASYICVPDGSGGLRGVLKRGDSISG